MRRDEINGLNEESIQNTGAACVRFWAVGDAEQLHAQQNRLPSRRPRASSVAALEPSSLQSFLQEEALLWCRRALACSRDTDAGRTSSDAAMPNCEPDRPTRSRGRGVNPTDRAQFYVGIDNSFGGQRYPLVHCTIILAHRAG